MNNKEYILGFNIGNTNTKMGIYGSDDISPQRIFTFKTDIKNKARDLEKIVNNFIDDYVNEARADKLKVEGIIISSVVTEVDEQYKVFSKKYFNHDLVDVSSRSKLDIVINYDNPEELGADRIANAVAAFKEYGTDIIVIDMGTANTFSVVSKNGIFEGGLISPGIGISNEVLFNMTSKLPKVNFEKPDKIIATNPVDAVKSGYYYGTMSMFNGIITEIEKVYKKEFCIILTGGFSGIISKYFKKDYILEPLLTMKGIKYIYNMNANV